MRWHRLAERLRQPVDQLLELGVGEARFGVQQQVRRERHDVAAHLLRGVLRVALRQVELREVEVFAPFVDYGKGKDLLAILPSTESQELLSAGAGLLWNPWKPMHLEVYYGERLEDLGDTGDSLQDDGFHFMLTFGWSF